ncbi:electron transfer flavoprotein subunit beta/FixA family protein [Candidatus Sumerlaeota bacterium]|nr:electron transfer flavoprotein subunit beta/FixA family protein [Candidatus Sumerlaeota bacterium]
MNIVVLVKQVIDSNDGKFDPATGLLVRAGQPATINALDEYAVEEALRLKEKLGGTVTALTMGPAGAVEILKHAVAMGADEAVHLCDDALAGSDSQATAHALARAVLTMGEVDLVLCGAESFEGATASVGVAVAASLGLPCVTFVKKIEEIGDGKAIVQRAMEEGYDRIETPLPAVMSVIKEINEPRISSLKGKMRAKKYAPKTLGVADLPEAAPERLGAVGSKTRVVRTFPPTPRPSGVKIEGEPDEMAEKLFAALKG